MNKYTSPTLPFLFRPICVLMIVLIQFPAIALGFDFGRLNFSNQHFSFYNAAPAGLLVAFSNAASITINDRATLPPNGVNGISSPYPSQIAVSGLSGTVSNVTVTLTNYSTARTRDIDVVLVAPTGQALMLMSDCGTQDLNDAVSNINLTFSDSAATAVPFANTPGGDIPSGTYRPTDVNISNPTGNDDFPAPGPASINRPAPTGTATFANVFNGVAPNGNWSLYAIDDGLGGGASTIAGGWSIDITTAGGVTATNTTVVSNLNPANTGQTITFTSTTTQVPSGTVSTGTVSFTNNGVAIAGCQNIAVNASGQAACSTTSPQGTRNIVASYSGTATLGASSGSLTQTVNSPTVVTGSQFCNNGGVTVPDLGAADVYPVSINVSGLVGTISKVTTQVNGLTVARPNNLDLLLVGPTSTAFQFMSDVGDSATAVSNINLNVDDAAASAFPNGTALSGGTYRPSDYSGGVGENDTYPAPAPASFSRPAPTGTATFASVFNGTNPNGTWSVYAVDDIVGGGASTISGLCLTFTLAKLNTTVNLTSSPNPVTQLQNVTFTATVSSSQTPSGSVQFFDGATSLGIVAVNGSGVATLTTNSLPPGNRNITAQYLGANVGAGGGGFNASTSNTVVQQVLVPTAASVTIAGRISTASGRGITKALIEMTDGNGNTRYAMTNPFGYYRFVNVPVGATYVFSIKAKNAAFTPRIISVTENITELNFTEQSP